MAWEESSWEAELFIVEVSAVCISAEVYGNMKDRTLLNVSLMAKCSNLFQGVSWLPTGLKGRLDRSTSVSRLHLITPVLMCGGIPEVCPADLAQGLHVFLTNAVCLSGQTALSVLLLPPLALWEHTWSRSTRKINTFLSFSILITDNIA